MLELRALAIRRARSAAVTMSPNELKEMGKTMRGQEYICESEESPSEQDYDVSARMGKGE